MNENTPQIVHENVFLWGLRALLFLFGQGDFEDAFLIEADEGFFAYARRKAKHQCDVECLPTEDSISMLIRQEHTVVAAM